MDLKDKIDEVAQNATNEAENDNEVRRKRVARVLYVIAGKGATYPTEISHQVSLNVKQVSRLLHDLKEKGLVQRLYPSFGHNDQRLLDRRIGMWRDGYKGLEAFQERSWYALPEYIEAEDGRNKLILKDTNGVRRDVYGHPVDEDEYDAFIDLRHELGFMRSDLEA